MIQFDCVAALPSDIRPTLPESQIRTIAIGRFLRLEEVD